MADRQCYIDKVLAYFTALDERRLDDVLSYFDDDALFIVQSAYIECRGRAAIRAMFEQYLATYVHGLHTDFEHIVDAEHGSISSRFRVELETAEGLRETRHSVNHWYFSGERFARVYVWISGENVLQGG
ncbi:MAG: nuclear transport factor 2 family protein [Gammaproteobacteria bacterium]